MSEAAPLLVPRGGGSLREAVAALPGFAGLAPVLRTLLTTDGTVTEALAAFYGEDVGVEVLSQGYRAYEGRLNRELEAAVGTRMLERTIVLVGAASGRRYAAARSRIVPVLLPPGLQEGLLAEREPLGKLMLAHRLETFREIVAVGRCPAGEAPLLGTGCADALGLGAGDGVVWRTYRVVSGGRPVMSVTEFFPECFPEIRPETPG
jgi:chorismate-pyruvate lyase